MDSQALSDLYSDLQAQGFTGQLEPLRELLLQAEADTTERRVLAWWKGLNKHGQYAALTAVYAHARKHAMSISTYEFPGRLTLVLSRKRDFQGVCLGRIEVSTRDVRWCFYRGNDMVGDLTVEL